MELTRLWEIIRRRKWIVLQALVITTFVSVVGVRLTKPTYDASCKILFMPPKKSASFAPGIGLKSKLSSFITTTSDLSVNRLLGTTRPYLQKLVLRLQLRDDDGNLSQPDKLADPGAIPGIKEKLFPERHIRVRQNEDTNILNILATSPDPEEAMMMANTLGDIMVEQNRKSLRAEYKNAREFVETQLSLVKESYSTALLRMASFRKEEHTLGLELDTKLAAEKMAALLKEKEDNIIDLAEARAKLDRLKEQLARENPEFLSATAMQQNPHIDVLKKKLTELRLQLIQAKADLTESHPQVLSLRQQLNVAEAELSKEVAVYRASAPELTALERRIASHEAHLKGVNSDLSKYFKTFEALPDKMHRESGLSMDLRTAQQRYSSLLDSYHQVEMAEASTLSEIRVVEPAVSPSSPVAPGGAKNAVLGMSLGLILGLALALFVEYQDDTIRTVEDARELRQIGLMGLVPSFGSKERVLISTKDPNDPVCECYRRIRNYPSIDDGSISSLLITSPGPSEGKSTTVVNLGISIARERKKVVLVDMDLRRASLHAYFNLPNHVGVTDMLQGEASLDEAIQDTPVEGLSIISSGPPSPDAGVLIESGELGSLISGLTTRFDMVIIDSAPVLVKSDALVLAKHVDGSIVVLESEKTTRGAALQLAEILADAHIKPLGFILNRFSIGKGKHFYRQYYYGRHSRELLAEGIG
jgi:succinoglycan biosynthesis transport protein ExoP